MATASPVDLDTKRLRDEIRVIYARVATDPSSEFHFHRGPAYAAERLGYDPTALAALPSEATASFAGVANPLRMAALPAGATVVDIGCGAGMDLMLAASAVGPGGHAIGIDMTEPMAQRARTSAHALGFAHVEVRAGDALDLPVDSESVDFAISNGVLNLTPDKRQAYSEVFRILKPGGQFLYADIIVGNELSESIRRDVDLWTGWIAGALPEAELLFALKSVGFTSVRISEYFDPFGGTSKERVVRKYGVTGVNVHALKSW